MANLSGAIKNTVSISQFHKGMASRIFSEVKQGNSKVVIKNNEAECVLLSPDEYLRLADALEDSKRELFTARRTHTGVSYLTLSENDALALYGSTEERLPRRTYTIVGGVNGTGKSSLSGVLKAQLMDLGPIIDVDKITAENGGSAIQGGKIALEMIRDCLDKGLSFTQETTLSGRKTEMTAQEARKRGYSVRLYYVGLDSVEECLRRIENRVAHGGHDIRETDVKRRFAGRWEAVAKVLPCCDEARFFDNYNGFTEVAEYVGGELILQGNNPPGWVKELRDYLQRSEGSSES